MERRVENEGYQNRPHGSIAELQALLQEFDTAMLVTMTPDGLLRGRPMAIQDPGELPDCDLWFVTQDNAAKTGEIAREHQVAVCCYRPRDRAYVSISALAVIEQDPAKLQRLWKPEWNAWISDGPAASHAALLKLKIERAEYWAPKGGTLQILYDKAIALVQGERHSEAADAPKHL